MDGAAMVTAVVLLSLSIAGAVTGLGTLLWVAVTNRRDVYEGEVEP